MRDNRSLVPNTDSAPPRVRVIPEERILNYFQRNPTSNLRMAGRHFRVHHKTILKVLKRDKRKPYKYKKLHALLPRDKPVREIFCRWIETKLLENPDFLFNGMWTDESTFTRNGLWNRQNLRYWSRVNPRLGRETSHQYRFAVNVWAGIHRNTIIGPVFIDGNLNGEKFLELLNGPVSDYIEELSVDAYRQMWYVVPIRRRTSSLGDACKRAFDSNVWSTVDWPLWTNAVASEVSRPYTTGFFLVGSY
ncbi:unnamed protein product [Colias eurytheme]|nr:unnamed protein product [Colias eurytheme]